MLQRTILFRADGNPSIGMGHFTRTLALAEMLKDDFRCIFVTQTPTYQQRMEIERVCFDCFDLPSDDSHFDIFLSLLKGDEVVVLDNYYFSTNYQKAIKFKGCTLACIDDMHNQPFVADLIINHAPGITPYDYEAQPYTKFVLGLDYALLRPLFLEQTQIDRTINKLDTILICFGGADPTHLTERTLKTVTSLKQFSRILVITGVAFTPTTELAALIAQDARIDLRHSLNERQMLEAMIEADLAIVPSSSILLELMTVGVGVLMGYYVENQRDLSTNFGALQVAINLGDLRIDYEEKLLEQLKNMTLNDVRKMIQHQKRMLRNSKSALIHVFKSLPI